VKEKDINKLHEYAKLFAEQIKIASLDMQKEIMSLADAKDFKIKEVEIKEKIEELNNEVFSLKDKLTNL
jgi:uncharacterized protein YceH (UPF0502 family)